MAKRSSFGDILEPGFRKVFFKRLEDLPEQYTQVFNIETSDKQDEKYSSVSQVGIYEEVSEGGTYPYEDPTQGYDTTLSHKSWKKAVKVTEELYEDDQYNIIGKVPGSLATSARRTQETVAADVFNYAFTSGGGGNAAFTAGDAVALCSDSHPRADGGAVQDNYVTADLDEDSIEAAKVTMRATLDDKGQKVLVQPDKIVVPPALEKEAMILMKSSGRVGTANNDTNVFKGMFDIVVLDYLTSNTAWFMMDSSKNGLLYLWRIKPTFEQDTAQDTGEALYKSRMRFSVGWTDWRGFYGSTGDNA